MDDDDDLREGLVTRVSWLELDPLLECQGCGESGFRAFSLLLRVPPCPAPDGHCYYCTVLYCTVLYTADAVGLGRGGQEKPGVDRADCIVHQPYSKRCSLGVARG